MKEWSNVHEFNFPWGRMVEAAFRKYPNPHSPNVYSLDTLERRGSSGPPEAVCSQLYSHRVFCTRWSIPTLVEKVIGGNPEIMINEQSLCDATSKVLTIRARNITLSSLFVMDEMLEYSQCPDDSTKTVLKQTAKINVFGIPLVGGILESIWISQYESTVENGRKGVEYVAKKLTDEHSNFDSYT